MPPGPAAQQMPERQPIPGVKKLVAIASGKDRRVDFDLVSFYHNRSNLIGVDTSALTGTEIKASMNELSAGFQQGYLEIPEVTTFPFVQAVGAYEAVEAGKATAKQILVF